MRLRRHRTSTAAAGSVLLAAALTIRAQEPVAVRGVCPNPAGPVAVGAAQWNGWGRDLENSRYQPEPAIRAADVPKLRFKWAYSFDAPGNDTQPTVVDGRVFIAGSAGRVFALDARTGCTYWTFDAGAAVHTAVVVGELAPPRTIATHTRGRRKAKKNAHIEMSKPPSSIFFGDDAGTVYALDAQTGHVLWETPADPPSGARLSGSPTLFRDRLYVPVSSQPTRLVALDIVTGHIVWNTSLSSGAGGLTLASAPTIDVKRELLYVATGAASGPSSVAADAATAGSAQPNADSILALGLADGRIRWVKQPAAAGVEAGFSASPILRNLEGGRQVLIAAQNAGLVYGLDPADAGAVLWQTRIEGAGAQSIEWGAAADHRRVFVVFSAAAGTPPADAATGGIEALDIATGRPSWTSAAPPPPCAPAGTLCSHAQSQAITVMPGIAFSGSLDGHLRAYSTIDGKLVWDVDTAQAAQQAGGPAAGGPMDRGGPAIVGGMLYVNAGSSLLAFVVDRK